MLTPYSTTNLGTLYNGNCLEVMKEFPDSSVDMILTDPPYGVNYCSSRTNRKEMIVNDKFDDWQKLLPEMFKEFKRIIVDTGCCCCCCCGGGETPVTPIFIMKAIEYFNLIQTLVWHKLLGLGWKYRSAYENIVILSKSSDNYKFYDITKKCGNVIEGIDQKFPQYREKEGGYFDDHPTQKPVKLMMHLLKIHSKENDLVLDPFLGCGSTAIACEKLNRRWIGIELEEKYCIVAKQRIENEANQHKFI